LEEYPWSDRQHEALAIQGKGCMIYRRCPALRAKVDAAVARHNTDDITGLIAL